MNEAALRSEVLIPLLRAMGYNDVFLNHGGAGEQGKDIVAWKADDLGQRENLAIVAKASALSGKAQADRGTAGEIQTQIRQCFGSPYADPVTGEQQFVHRVWVMSNKRITKEAVTAITAAVGLDLMRSVRFIDGDALWKHVKDYLPTSVWDIIEEARKQAESVDTHYRPEIQISGDTTTITLKEKFPGASEEKPINITTSLVFPNKEAAEGFRIAYQRHLETGEPFEVPIEFVKYFNIPEFLQSIVGVKDIKPQLLQVLPLSSPFRVPCRIDFTCDDGETFSFDYVLLRLDKSGTKEITLVNDERDVPFHITLVLRPEDKSGGFTVRPRDIAFNVVQYYDLLRVFSCLSKHVKIKVTNLETGIQFFEMTKAAGDIEQPHPSMIEAFRRLAEIQRRTKRVLVLPNREITREEWNTVAKTYHIITTGRLEGTWAGFETEIVPDKDSMSAILDTFGDGREGMLREEGEEVVEIFGVEIPLGVSSQIIQSAQLVNIDEIQQGVEKLLSGEGSVVLRFVPRNNANLVKEYPSWLPQD